MELCLINITLTLLMEGGWIRVLTHPIIRAFWDGPFTGAYNPGHTEQETWRCQDPKSTAHASSHPSQVTVVVKRINTWKLSQLACEIQSKRQMGCRLLPGITYWEMLSHLGPRTERWFGEWQPHQQRLVQWSFNSKWKHSLCWHQPISVRYITLNWGISVINRSIQECLL